MKRILILGAVLALTSALCTGCAADRFHYNYKDEVTEYAMIAQDGDLKKLNEYPNLTYVDLRGSTCYDEILDYTRDNPDVTVRYNVQLGQKRFNQDTKEVTLYGYEVNYDSLANNLKYLPDVNAVHIHQIELQASEIAALQEAYPHISFTYTVEISGQRYDHTVTELNLSNLSPSDLSITIERITLLPNLTDVQLMDESGGSKLALAEVTQLIHAFPSVNFHYTFRLFGQEVSVLSKELVFDTVTIGNEGIADIRLALDAMTKCTYVKLDSCGIDDEVMAQLRSDYPDKEIVWRVFAGKYNILTDEEMLRMTFSLTEEDVAGLQYCNNVKYLDMTSSRIANISFVSHMPNLECVILTLTKINDLTPLTNCPNLTWLELSSCTGIRDLSALSDMTNLKYLNISNTNVGDLTALEKVPLERFNCVKSDVKSDMLDWFVEKHPNCLTTSRGSTLGYGWRYNDKEQKDPFSYYAELRKIFRYDEKGFWGSHKE